MGCRKLAASACGRFILSSLRLYSDWKSSFTMWQNRHFRDGHRACYWVAALRPKQTSAILWKWCRLSLHECPVPNFLNRHFRHVAVIEIWICKWLLSGWKQTLNGGKIGQLDRLLPTHLRQSALILRFPKPVIRDVLLSTHSQPRLRAPSKSLASSHHEPAPASETSAHKSV